MVLVDKNVNLKKISDDNQLTRTRSEERRVGKECRWGWWGDD